MCATEATAVEAEPNAVALANCATTNVCQADCCLCGATCDPFGTNFGKGPCKMQVDTATGYPNSTAIADGTAIEMACKDATSDCGKAEALGTCEVNNCQTACNPKACTM